MALKVVSVKKCWYQVSAKVFFVQRWSLQGIVGAKGCRGRRLLVKGLLAAALFVLEAVGCKKSLTAWQEGFVFTSFK